MNQLKKINWLFPLLLVLYEIAMYLSNDMYLPALPDMMRNLQLTSAHAQLTVTMWFVGAASTPLIMGAIADRFGRRSVLLWGGLLYVLATMICALAVSEQTLLIPRIFEGAMVSSMMVAGYATIHELYEHRKAIQILAIMGAISVIAPAFGPLLGGFVLIVASWRCIFWIIALYSLIMLSCLYYKMPETLAPEKHQPLHIGSLLTSYGQVLANRQFVMLMAVLGLSFMGFISWVTAGPLLVIDSMKFSQVTFGWMQVFVFSAYILGSRFVDILLKKRSAPQLVTLGLLISLAAGIGLLMVSLLLPNQFYLFVLAIVVYSFGSALSFAPLNRLIVESTDQPMGIRMAILTAGIMGFGALGSGVASLIYNGTSFSLGVITMLSIAGACLLQCIHNRR